MEYASLICEYCRCTDFGYKPVNNVPWNMCDGDCCEEALDAYNADVPEDKQFASLEDAF